MVFNMQRMRGCCILLPTCLKTETETESERERERHIPSYVSRNHLSDPDIFPSTKQTHLLFSMYNKQEVCVCTYQLPVIIPQALLPFEILIQCEEAKMLVTKPTLCGGWKTFPEKLL